MNRHKPVNSEEENDTIPPGTRNTEMPYAALDGFFEQLDASEPGTQGHMAHLHSVSMVLGLHSEDMPPAAAKAYRSRMVASLDAYFHEMEKLAPGSLEHGDRLIRANRFLTESNELYVSTIDAYTKRMQISYLLHHMAGQNGNLTKGLYTNCAAALIEQCAELFPDAMQPLSAQFDKVRTKADEFHVYTLSARRRSAPATQA